LLIELSTIKILVALLAVIALATSSNTILRNSIQVLAQHQEQQTQNSVQHNAIGHGSHQVVNLQNASEGVVYKGIVSFNSSELVDIIPPLAALCVTEIGLG
jgi:redox-regulated HSP33 family molecular chaperone